MVIHSQGHGRIRRRWCCHRARGGPTSPPRGLQMRDASSSFLICDSATLSPNSFMLQVVGAQGCKTGFQEPPSQPSFKMWEWLLLSGVGRGENLVTFTASFIVNRFFDAGHSNGWEVIPHCSFDVHFSNEWCWASFQVFISCIHFFGEMSV